MITKRLISSIPVCLQGCRPYRVLAKRLLGKRVRYYAGTYSDASRLSRFYGYERVAELRDPIMTWRKHLGDLKGCGHVLVADVGERIAGAAVVRRFPEDDTLYSGWWLFSLAVRVRFRGAGIGEGLVCMATEKAAEDGGKKMDILVFEHGRAALRLYRKMGFQQSSIPGLNELLEEEFRREGRRRIIMSRIL